MTHTHTISYRERMGLGGEADVPWINMCTRAHNLSHKKREYSWSEASELARAIDQSVKLRNEWLAQYGATTRDGEYNSIHLDFPSREHYVAWCLAWS